MEKKSVNHQQFLEEYNAGKIMVLVNKSKAGDFVMSEFADKNNKRAHQFWTWTGIAILILVPIVLLILQEWIYAGGAFILGLIINSAARKSAGQFVLQNMIKDGLFWDYVLIHGGAIMRDSQGNKIVSGLSDRDATKEEIEKTIAAVEINPESSQKAAEASVNALNKISETE